MTSRLLLPFAFAASIVAFACGGGADLPPGGGAPSGAPPSSSAPGTSGGSPARSDETATGGSTSPSPKTSAPEASRATASACTGTRPPGMSADPRAEDTCASDSECTAGLDGRCSFWGGKRSCTYHDCTTDSDCTSPTAVCGCALGIDKRNVCLENSACRTNGDCPADQYCALSRLPGVPLDGAAGAGGGTFYGQAWGYFCTTTSDLCRSAADCASQPHDHSCVYYTTQKRWACGGGP